MKMKTKNSILTKVIFRKWPKREGGDVIALFPEVASSYIRSYDCESYQHIGQHGGASPDIVQWTRPATPEEYAPLKRELESIGYVLRVVKKFTRAAYEKRELQSRRK